jgi:hypothetical protein
MIEKRTSLKSISNKTVEIMLINPNKLYQIIRGNYLQLSPNPYEAYKKLHSEISISVKRLRGIFKNLGVEDRLKLNNKLFKKWLSLIKGIILVDDYLDIYYKFCSTYKDHYRFIEEINSFGEKIEDIEEDEIVCQAPLEDRLINATLLYLKSLTKGKFAIFVFENEDFKNTIEKLKKSEPFDVLRLLYFFTEIYEDYPLRFDIKISATCNSLSFYRINSENLILKRKELEKPYTYFVIYKDYPLKIRKPKNIVKINPNFTVKDIENFIEISFIGNKPDFIRLTHRTYLVGLPSKEWILT